MIETREQKEKFKGFGTKERYGLLKALRNGWKRSGDGHKASISDGAIETIEALREVARAAKAKDNDEVWSAGRLHKALAKLPDWLLEE